MTLSEKPTSRHDSVSEDISKEEIKHYDHAATLPSNPNVRLANPLEGIPHDQLVSDAALFAKSHGLGQYSEVFQKGALVAQDPTAFETLALLDDEDRHVLRREITHRWSQPGQLYYLVIMCSMAAAVQGVSVAFCRKCTAYSFVVLADG